MTEDVQLLDVVALIADVPGERLRRGQVGTVVELLDAQTFEVEFTDDDGQTFALLPLKAAQLLVLHHEPAIPGVIL